MSRLNGLAAAAGLLCALTLSACQSASGGSGARLLGTRPFGVGHGGGAQRKYWEQVLDLPEIGHGYYWVRPVFSGSEGTPSQLLSHSQEWHVAEIYQYQPNGEVFSLPGLDMTLVNGKPAIIMIREDSVSTASYFTYLAAEDAHGTSWGQAIPVMNEMKTHGSPSLAEVNGRPAFTWYDSNTIDGLRYIRAAAADGSAWVAPLTIDSITDAGLHSELRVVNGKPVVAYTNGFEQLKVAPAQDADGSMWYSGIIVLSGADLDWWDAAVLDGGLCLAVDLESDASWIYEYCTIDGGGVTVDTTTAVFPPQAGSNNTLHLGLTGVRPYLVVRRDEQVQYSFSLDDIGNSWSVPVSTGLAGTVGTFGGTEAYGVPWVCYYDTGKAVRSGRASAPQSNLWLQDKDVKDATMGISHMKMVRAGIHPAACFVDVQTKLLNYAIYY